MPIYEYKCQNCGKEFEMFVKPCAVSLFNKKTDCPDCSEPGGKPSIARRVEVSAANFKVNGFNADNGYSQ